MAIKRFLTTDLRHSDSQTQHICGVMKCLESRTDWHLWHFPSYWSLRYQGRLW